MKPLHELGASEAVRLLADKTITSEALVRACLERIDAREGEVQAWACLDHEAALRQARAADAQPVRGLLHGLPIGVKDLIDTVDMPTSYGSPIYRAHRPAWDAACVALARAAGAVVMGKTVTTEFAVMHPNKTRNPHDTGHTPGGSSSGSAAAVADFMVPVAFGTQTAGSIIRPSAYCGVVGYKPSFGMISRVGVKALSDILDTVGAIARTVPDVALLVAAVTGRKDLLIDEAGGLSPGQRATPLRIGICRTHEWQQAQPETVEALESAATKLSAAGAQVKDVDLPPAFAGLVAAQIDIMFRQQADSLAYERLNHWSKISERLQGILESGLKVTVERFDEAVALTRACRRQLEDVYSDCDVLLAPSAPGAAPAGLAMTGDPVFNRMWTLLQVPCVNLPAGKMAGRLPVGLQVVGPLGGDARMLAAAHWVHRVLA
jgi:Asp-tRNA(Asn)/Glu-tRNA(Gln) amidotransferase A subunit family amidase